MTPPTKPTSTASNTAPSPTTSPTASISATTSAKSSTETPPTHSQKTTSSTSSAGSAKGGVSNGNHKRITIAVVVVGAGLVLLAVVLMRRCSKQKAQENEHVYATIPDSTAPATQPDSSPPRIYEAVYCLAGDPDIVKLGLKNQAENTTDLVYSTVQPVQPAVLNEPSPDHLYTVLENPTADSPQIPQTPPTVNPSDLVYSMVQPVQKKESPDLQINKE
ncbi:uncharacterized protein LOC125788955 [Astyanax mexicanus]|uniref:uncharacterized protein LOC125788955 n=1 Tax=Astyanax mexicanus TaxID=7994 RepID=UPI0020CB2BDD|nr:uncharacterized protein LOC125788955 [Astyanax mexicanus]